MPTNILILCTHNAARSVLAEAMLNHWAQALGQPVRGHSAGSAPSGRVHPLALQVLRQAGVRTDGLQSKSWDRFTQSTPLRVVITVCDNAAAEPCPYWPGAPVQVHWGYPDPSAASGDEDARLRAFELTRQALGYRLLQLLALPWAILDDDALRQALQAIGRN